MLLAVRIVIAPDSFKGSLTADAAADGDRGRRCARVMPGRRVRAPAGRRRGRGHGRGRAAGRLGGRARRASAVRTARRSTATFALRERTAVVELATAAGIGLLAPPAPDDREHPRGR